jgi:hypothetical protein
MHDLFLTLPHVTMLNVLLQAYYEQVDDQLSSADTENYSDMPDLDSDTE